jgi:phosphate transport system substrate-binding protein
MKKKLRNGKFISRLPVLLKSAGLILISLALTDCSAKKGTPGSADEKVAIRGSNTIGEELVPRLIGEYKKNHPAVAFDLESKGSGYGFGNLLVGGCDIAASSREANTNEVAMAKDRDVELKGNIIGSYAVAVIVNAASPVGNLTREQVRDIFTGAIQNWKDVGGPDAPIHLYIRDPISGTYLGFRELAMENKLYALEPKTFTNYTGIVHAVAQDAGGIGYAGIFSDPAAEAVVKTVTIGGIAPTADAVNKGQYPYARALYFYTNKAKETPVADNFIQFVLSPDGQAILKQMGYAPHP